MCEFTADLAQTVADNEAVVFTDAPVPCREGLVRHRDDTGSFLLKGKVETLPCGCVKKATHYLVNFSANIAVPTGQTPQEISLVLQVDGTSVPASTMLVVPAAAGDFFNVSKSIVVDIWSGCCENVSVVNTSGIPITVQNAVINFSV